MATAIVVIVGLIIVAGLVWAALQPAPDTELGRKNAARKRAKKAQDLSAPNGLHGDADEH